LPTVWFFFSFFLVFFFPISCLLPSTIIFGLVSPVFFALWFPPTPFSSAPGFAHCPLSLTRATDFSVYCFASPPFFLLVMGVYVQGHSSSPVVPRPRCPHKRNKRRCIPDFFFFFAKSGPGPFAMNHCFYLRSASDPSPPHFPNVSGLGHLPTIAQSNGFSRSCHSHRPVLAAFLNPLPFSLGFSPTTSGFVSSCLSHLAPPPALSPSLSQNKPHRLSICTFFPSGQNSPLER